VARSGLVLAWSSRALEATQAFQIASAEITTPEHFLGTRQLTAGTQLASFRLALTMQVEHLAAAMLDIPEHSLGTMPPRAGREAVHE